jgi:hypothetical protein
MTVRGNSQSRRPALSSILLSLKAKEEEEEEEESSSLLLRILGLKRTAVAATSERLTDYYDSKQQRRIELSRSSTLNEKRARAERQKDEIATPTQQSERERERGEEEKAVTNERTPHYNKRKEKNWFDLNQRMLPLN